uniref:Uncharacterized protein n=1 Tax=Anguilla anguilla TaxID=7936 RepID=A0A0E9PPH6_ANGAN
MKHICILRQSGLVHVLIYISHLNTHRVFSNTQHVTRYSKQTHK